MDQTQSLLGSRDPALAESAGEGEGDDELAVIVRLADDKPLPAGVRIVTRFGDIATLRVPRQLLTELAESSAVAALEGPRKFRVANVVDQPPVETDDPDTGTGAASAPSSYIRRPEGLTATGKGVVIGVVDWGVDLAHPALRRDSDGSGSSRVLALWDQRRAAAGEGANRWGYGRIFSREQIDAALRTGDPYTALDYHPADSDERDARDGAWRGAHGMHVVDIAAGALGIANDSDIVFVHLARTAKPVGPDPETNLGESATILEALDMVFSVAGDRPCVVNMSLGAISGPHDGSTLVEQGIDDAVWLRSGRACVNSAGNYFASRAHAQGRIDQGGEDVIAFHVPAGDPTDSELELYYESVDRFTVALIEPAGTEVARLGPGNDSPIEVAGRVAGHIYHRVRGATHGDRHVHVFFRAQAPGGTWQLRLHGEVVQDGRYHAWIERDQGPRPSFGASHVTPNGTTGTLCNGRLSITVGAYDPHRPGRPMAGFSSAGPTRDGRVKPEIAAPGRAIVAARSTPHGESPAARYVSKSGTSMATPHVTGAIALMFEVAGRPLEIVETRALLFSSADCPLLGDGGPAVTDLHRIGYGYLNIVAAVKAAREWGRRSAELTEEHVASDAEEPSPVESDDVGVHAMSIDAQSLMPASSRPALGATPDDAGQASQALDVALVAREFQPVDAQTAEGTEPEPPQNIEPSPALDAALLAHGVQTVDTEAMEILILEETLAKGGTAWSERASEGFDMSGGDLTAGASSTAGQAVEDSAEAEAAPPNFRETFLELAADPPLGDAENLRAVALSAAGRRSDDRFLVTGTDGLPPEKVRSGDLLVRSAPAQGIDYTAVILSDQPESAAALIDRGVIVERGGPGLYVEVAEAPAHDGCVRTIGRRLSDRWGQMPPGQAVLRAESAAFGEDDPPHLSTDPDDNPLAGWVPDRESLVLLVGDNRLFILPSVSMGVLVPAARLGSVDWRQVLLRRDLEPWLGLPAVGAGGSRIFKAGPRLAVMLDAGRNPRRQPAAMYMDHLVASARNLGVSEVRAVILIHRHSDHMNEVPTVVRQYNIAATNVIMPRAFARQAHDTHSTATLDALHRIFGAGWQPSDLSLKPTPASTGLHRGRYTFGTLSFEFFADAAKLRLEKHTDAASLLTRVIQQRDPNPIVVLGDLRGADLEAFYRHMGAEQWREFFRGVEVIDGFSHHRGRLERADVPGIMRLLEATLLQTGRVTFLLQTDPGQHVQARADTLEFMRRVGAKVEEVHVAASAQPSGVVATTRGAVAAGPHAQTHAPLPSALTAALGRITRLYEARATLVLWSAHIARYDPSFNMTAQVRQIDQSLDDLRGATGAAVQQAANVRVSGSRASGGGRDYTGGTAGAAFVASLSRIPATTAAETAIGPAGFAAIARTQSIPPAEVPLLVALKDALDNGRFTREAFRYVVGQLDPATRRSIFTGPRGKPREGLALTDRLGATLRARTALAAGMSVTSAAHLRPGGRRVARGVAGVLGVVELGGLVAQGVQSYRISRATARRQNIAPFLQRLAFWRQLGVAVAAVAVDDPTFGSTSYERDPVKIDKGLVNDDWDFLYIEHTAQRPALSDAEILKLIALLGHMVRNYDEYATLFEDTRQDAIRFVGPPGQPWSRSRWEVRVGSFSTSGSNHVVERWEELPLLSEGMNALVRRVMANTTELLNRIGRGESADTQELGTLQHPPGRPLYRARLVPGNKRPIELRVRGVPNYGPSIHKIYHQVAWQTTTPPEFYVWEVTDVVEAHVSGANFETYHRLRDLESLQLQLVMGPSPIQTVQKVPIGNQKADGWMLTTDFVRI